MKLPYVAVALVNALSSSFVEGARSGNEAKNYNSRDLQGAMSLLELVEGSTLATAVELADLTDDLSGDGAFTVLAPSDEAFEGVPAKYLEPQFKFHLQNVLLYQSPNQE